MKNSNSSWFEVASLGCKVNQAEAGWLTQQLAAQEPGPSQGGDPLSLAVLLTCTVTGAAARQSRQAARRLAREHPGARVVITGCDAQVAPKAYLREGFTVLPRAGLSALPRMVQGLAPWPGEKPWPNPAQGQWCPGERAPGPGRTRGLLKVQDGCDACCAYCIVPRARGGPRSLPLDEAAAAWQRLGQAGTAEVVLTGIHLGRYGRDLGPGHDLARLVEELLAAHQGPLLRLSSLEADEVSPALLDLMARQPRLAPHLHLPLQTGSDRLLAAMGRPYRAPQYRQVVKEAQAALPGLCLGADVLVGLPGEDDQAFAETRELIAQLPLSYLHVFPYSPRPGTPAASRPDRPSPAQAKQRAAELRRLGQAKKLAFLQAQVGRQLPAVVEGSGRARTHNYCLVQLDQAPPAGTRVLVRVNGLEGPAGSPQLFGQILP